MAQLPCTSCEAETAIVMFTDMSNGDTMSIGPQCLPGFALGLAATTSQGMAPETAEAYGAQFDQIRANDSRTVSSSAGGADSGKPKARRARPSLSLATAPDTEQPLPPGETPNASDQVPF